MKPYPFCSLNHFTVPVAIGCPFTAGCMSAAPQSGRSSAAWLNVGQNRRFVSYLRVSTNKQGALGLGIEAQRRAVEDYLNGGRWTVVAEFVEVEPLPRL